LLLVACSDLFLGIELYFVGTKKLFLAYIDMMLGTNAACGEDPLHCHEKGMKEGEK
jgi:hypothetical protein